jgi:hypothetical protein
MEEGQRNRYLDPVKLESFDLTVAIPPSAPDRKSSGAGAPLDGFAFGQEEDDIDPVGFSGDKKESMFWSGHPGLRRKS